MIVTAGYITGIRTLADKSINVTTTTQELTPEQAGNLFSIQGKYVKVLFSEEAISQDLQNEVAGLELEEPGKKQSKSQELRSVLYRAWLDKGNGGDFKDFYDKKMEIIINHFKDKYLNG